LENSSLSYVGHNAAKVVCILLFTTIFPDIFFSLGENYFLSHLLGRDKTPQVAGNEANTRNETLLK
jgi:hypothetical protein